MIIKDYPGSLYGSYRMPKFTDIYDNVDDFLADYKDIGIPTSITEQSANTLFYLLFSRYGNSTIAASDVTRFKYRLFGIIYQAGPTWEKKQEIQKLLRDMTAAQLVTGEGYTSNSTSDIKGSETSNNTSGQKQEGTNNNTSSGSTTSAGTKLTNNADNPSTAPNIEAADPLTFINRQQFEKSDGTTSNTGESDTTTSNKVDTTSEGSGSHEETGKNTLTYNKTKGTLDAYALLADMLKNDVTEQFLGKFQPLFLKFVAPELPLYYITEDSQDE